MFQKIFHIFTGNDNDFIQKQSAASFCFCFLEIVFFVTAAEELTHIRRMNDALIICSVSIATCHGYDMRD